MIKIIKKTSLLLLLGLFAVSCLDNPYNPIDPEEELFDWETTSTIELNVEVETISGTLNNYYRTVNVYSSPIFEKKSLMVSGSALPNNPFKCDLVIPSSYKKIYLEIIYPNGTKQQLVEVISSNTERVGVTAKSTLVTKSGEETIPSIDVPEWGEIPTSFDEVINYNFASKNLEGGKTYYVPQGYNVSGYLDCTNQSNSNAVLYVAGKLTMTSNAQMAHSNIVVLDGGELVISGYLATYSYAPSAKPSLYIMEKGKVTIKQGLFLEGTNSLVNNGILLNGYNMSLTNGYPKLYNTGTISNYNGYDYNIYISSYSTIYNDGVVDAEDMSLSYFGSIINYANGDISIDNYQQSVQIVLNNYGHIECEDMHILGRVNNYGYIGVSAQEGDDDSSPDLLIDYAAVFTNYDGSLLQTNIARLISCYLMMKEGSIVSFNDLKTSSSGYNIINEDGNYSLLIINENMYMDSRSYISGNVEIWHKTLNSKGNELKKNYSGKYNSQVVWIKDYEDRVVNIPKNDYNKGLGELTPVPSDDKDGDGVKSDMDIDDNDPTIAYRSYFPNNSEYGTILVEDLWPYTGDYDMNDVVCDYHVEWTSNANNKVVYLDYFWKLRAVGTTKKVAMAVQFDALPLSKVASINTTHSIVGELPLSSSNGLEPGQSLPVIPLFNDPEELFGSGNSKLINTNPELAAHPVKTHSFRMTFTEPVDYSSTLFSTINPFVVVTDFDSPKRDWEIHLPGFKRTSKASSTVNNQEGLSKNDIYLSNTGMMWMLRVPQSIGYPIELVNIEKAYTNYKAWYESLGESYPNWYIGPVDQSQIYSRVATDE